MEVAVGKVLPGVLAVQEVPSVPAGKRKRARSERGGEIGKSDRCEL